MEYRARYAADVASVFAAFLDRSFLDAYAREVGAISWDVDIDNRSDRERTEVRMRVPTGGISAVFKRLVTSIVEINEVRLWSGTLATTAAGVREGTIAVDAAVGRRNAKVVGTMTLRPAGPEGPAETDFHLKADIEVNVPFAGGLAVGLIEDLVTRSLDRQTRVMEAWLAMPDGA